MGKKLPKTIKKEDNLVEVLSKRGEY